MPSNEMVADIGLEEYKYGFITEESTNEHVYKAQPGLSEQIVRDISAHKNEPEWMLDFRLKALEVYYSKPMPKWGGDLETLDRTLDEIYYYLKPQEKMERSWDDVPQEIKDTFEKLGIPEAERKALAGVGAQYESEMVYHSLKKEWQDMGIIFESIEDGLRLHPELFREHFATVVPVADNKFAALNSAVWSGGSFVYIPKGVKVDIPLQAYFRVNAEKMGQFERTLIIVDEGAQAQYIEGCTAPVYTTESFHSGVIEIIVKPNARFRYVTIQNWSHNMYNLVTQRAMVQEHATMEWLDGNLGSKLTMKYPSCYLMGEGAHGEILSIAYAGDGQHQDTGGKVVHAAPNTTSQITSKSISKGTGRSTYRGLCKIYEGAENARSKVECDALLLNENSRTDTFPYIEIEEQTANVGHEATVSKIGAEQLFYLMSRGLSEEEASAMIVRGFIEPIAKLLPLEYAVELNRLIELEMEAALDNTAIMPERLLTQLDAEVLAERYAGEPDWLSDARSAALIHYLDTPLPTTRLEEWRYTDPAKLKWDRVSLASHNNGDTPDRLSAIEAAVGHAADIAYSARVVQSGARIVSIELPADLAARGVLIMDLADAARQHGDLVQKHLYTAAASSIDKFAAANAALWTAGVFVYVPKNVTIEAPIRIVRYIEEAGLAYFTRTLIVADDHSNFGVVEEFVSPDLSQPAFNCGVGEAFAGVGAKVQYVGLQRWGHNVHHLGMQRTFAQRDSKLDTLMVNLGASVARVDLAASLKGPGSRSDMLGLYFAQGDQHFDHSTRQNHEVPHAVSDLLYKGALDGKGRAIFRGLIKVYPKAQRTDAYQTNKNLLLSRTAECTSLPNLEIEADDVRCSHASTVGQLDKEELFYIMSRGIGRREAERLVVFGFFGDVLDRLPLPGVVRELRAAIAQKIAG